jgi:hypothetical protein
MRNTGFTHDGRVELCLYALTPDRSAPDQAAATAAESGAMGQY